MKKTNKKTKNKTKQNMMYMFRGIVSRIVKYELERKNGYELNKIYLPRKISIYYRKRIVIGFRNFPLEQGLITYQSF